MITSTLIIQASLLLGPVSLNIETKFPSWQSHLESQSFGDVSWREEKINLTECLTDCLCRGSEADCSSKGLTTLPSFTDKTSIIKTL